MWIADNWKDYEVIDTSGGEKLERWGDYILVRPDPQVIWDTPKKVKGWKKMNGHYHRSNKGGGEWEFFNLPNTWQINYGKLVFNLQPFKFKHTGLFPEQAVNWDWFGEKIKNAKRPVKVLNLFAYTGGQHLRQHRQERVLHMLLHQRHGDMGEGKCSGIGTFRCTYTLACG